MAGLSGFLNRAGFLGVGALSVSLGYGPLNGASPTSAVGATLDGTTPKPALEGDVAGLDESGAVAPGPTLDGDRPRPALVGAVTVVLLEGSPAAYGAAGAHAHPVAEGTAGAPTASSEERYGPAAVASSARPGATSSPAKKPST